MNLLEEVWEFPRTFLAWIVLHLIIWNDGEQNFFIDACAKWLDLDSDIIDDLINNEDDLSN